jgi:glycosyltransferase involved in cell wall biosynthesis
MACGTPVITVNRAALGEVAHGYGMTIEQPTVPALAEAMRQVLDDPELRSELSRKGLERARELRWPEAARRTLNVLREVAQQ